MPALYALGQHQALEVANAQLVPGEHLFAYLDDIYLITTRARARAAFDAVAAAIETHAGIRAHLGKLKAWSPIGGPAPTDLATLGPDVWRSDRPAHENRPVVLGTPLGSREFIEAHGQTRMEEEHRFLNESVGLPDPQCAWNLLSY